MKLIGSAAVVALMVAVSGCSTYQSVKQSMLNKLQNKATTQANQTASSAVNGATAAPAATPAAATASAPAAAPAAAMAAPEAMPGLPYQISTTAQSQAMAQSDACKNAKTAGCSQFAGGSANGVGQADCLASCTAKLCGQDSMAAYYAQQAQATGMNCGQ